MSKISRFVGRFLVLFAIMAFIAPMTASAQGATDPLPPLDLNWLIAQAFVALSALLGGWLTSPATVYITAILKRYLPTSVKAEWIAALVALLLVALVAVAAKFGIESQIRTGISIATGILGVILGSSTNLSKAGEDYNKALSVNAPIKGYQRTGAYAAQRALTESVYERK